jgi:SOS response regulatory protein OraA/RecX
MHELHIAWAIDVMRKGRSEAYVREELKKAGWKDEKIEEALFFAREELGAKKSLEEEVEDFILLRKKGIPELDLRYILLAKGYSPKDANTISNTAHIKQRL